MSATLNEILDDLEDAGRLGDDDALYEAFTSWAASTGRPLYPHQEEALVEILAGNHVIAATPTGSGKSMIALAAHFTSMAHGGRSYYTAPLKALVSEKFFDLVSLFGADNVGMVTGDVSLNADAPIICCTAEILANQSLREGPSLDADMIVMDEFHFYGDRQRGWAWQVPLLELTAPQVVAMSATLGDTSHFERSWKERTGRDVALVDDAERPVPLEFDYVVDRLPDTVERLLGEGRWPVYIVHFSQRDAVATAQSFDRSSLISADQKKEIGAQLAGVSFTKGFGQTLKSLLAQGIGVHHAGMLPRYRRLVERLTQAGLLPIVCGTDTLGVGINVPIRTVLMTSLVKYDGRRMRHVSAREFHQIAGRAGRAGFDTVGFVRVLAPEHEVESARERARLSAAQEAARDAREAKRAAR
ncbi:MAG: DEAD/DEAH box helicase, partial [Pauljensenia sp.]